MQGTRRDRPDDSIFEPGEYGKLSDGKFHGCTPNGHGCNLTNHYITQYPDGTISVYPSIEVRRPRGPVLWHGYLERGVWREV